MFCQVFLLNILIILWSGYRESNPGIQLGRLVFYHLTTPAYGAEDGTRTRNFHLGKVTLYH